MNIQVVIYKLEENSLHKAASYRTSTTPLDISIKGNSIAIADLMKSASIVEYKRGDQGLPDVVEETARHFQTAWATAIAYVDEYTVLESDAEGNLMVLHQNINGVTLEDQRRLEVTSEVRLGEMVNRIRSFTVPSSPNATVTPKAFLATVSKHTSLETKSDTDGFLERRFYLPIRAHLAFLPRSTDASSVQHGCFGTKPR